MMSFAEAILFIVAPQAEAWGGVVGGGMSMNVIDLMTLIEYTFTCIGIGIAIERYFKHKK